MTTDNGFGPDETALDAVGLPAIPVSAGALIFDRAGRLLILKPTYKSGWTIPGGVMEADGETPWDACRREVAEECGLHIGAGHPARLACMDFRRPRPGKPGGVRYLFDCGAVSDASLAGIVVQPEEIAEYRVADLRTALTMLRKPIRLRVRAATRGTRSAISRTAGPCRASVLPGRYTRDGVPSAGSRGSEHASDEEAKRERSLMLSPECRPLTTTIWRPVPAIDDDDLRLVSVGLVRAATVTIDRPVPASRMAAPRRRSSSCRNRESPRDHVLSTCALPSAVDANVVSALSIRPGRRVVISCRTWLAPGL